MPIWAIWLTILFGILWLLSLLFGILLYKQNNEFCILLLTISLNIIGTFIGFMIIYKNQHPNFKFWKNLGNKFKINKKIKVT